MKHNKKAFTLIELLVVVLIIGILTTVAVPQYQVAVAKSKYNTLKIQANALLNAVEVYHLTTNQWPTKLMDLDISLPGEIWWDTYIYIPSMDSMKSACYIWYDSEGNSGSVGCECQGLTYYVGFQDNHERICRITNDSNVKISKQVCFNETHDTAPTRGGLDYHYQD